jgi:hypothetical protein
MRLGNIVFKGNKFSIALFVALTVCISSPALATCGPARLETVQIERVSLDGDITLIDSRKLKLAGLHLVKPEAIAVLKAGDTISIGLLGQTVDRWSRLPALVFAGANQQEWLQERLIREGAALARPEDGLGGCWPLLSGIEKHYATQLGILKAEGGRFARIEGRVQRVSDGRTAKFIGLSGEKGERIAGMILKRHLKRFSDNGVDVDKLRGQIVRIRGVRNLRNATVISLTSVDQIEIVR